MVDTLAFVGLYGAVVGALYVYVGTQVGKREVPEEASTAQRMFLLWWYALGAVSIIGALNIGLYKLDALDPTYWIVIGQVNLVAIVLALLGLLYYMVYIYTGTGKWVWLIVVFYVLFYGLLLVFVALNWSPAEGFTDDGWSIQPLPEAEQTTPPIFTFVLVTLLVGPQFVAAIAFLRLGPRLDEPTQRYRVRLVGTAILFWFGTSLVSSIASTFTGVQLDEVDGWQMLTRIIGLGAVLAILAAYKPPKWVQKRYGIHAL